jgi:O-antigen ligase
VKTLVVMALCVGAIFAGRAIRGRPVMQRWLAMALGVMPFFLVSLNLVSNETYRGSSRGFEVTLVDLVAWCLIFALPKTEARSKVRGLYLVICTVSVFFAAVPLYSMFGLWKAMRMFWVAAAAYRVVSFGLGSPLLQGIVVGQVYAFLLAVEQRYLLGVHQVAGPFAHQNGLAQAAVLVYSLCLSISLGPGRSRWSLAGVLASVGCVVLTLSRGGIAMTLLSSVLVFLMSAYRHRDPRLIRVAIIGALLIGAVAVKAGDTLTERFTKAPDASAHARDLFEEMAELMVEDSPLVGVGLNHYSYANSEEGYADAVGMPEVDKGGVAHNVYWLTLAELGYPGLMAFLLMYCIPVLRGFRHAFGATVAVHGDVLQGMAVGVMAILIQGQLEYTLRLTMVSQMVWVYIGVIGAISASQASSLTMRST